MSLLTAQDVTIRVGGRTLLEGANLRVDAGRRIGLVGRNGAGKSTLLKAISGELAVDGGDIHLSPRARMAQVRQEAPSGPQNLLDTVLAADTERSALLAERDTATGERASFVADRLRTIGADAAPSRAATILAGLGFDTAAQARPVDSFSGGWRMRVALAAALFSQADLLLLDEPTNHLDLEATLWLESYLVRYPGACLVVSHDRGLLDRCVQAIAHLDNRRITLTPGGYDEFLRIRTEHALQQSRAAERIMAQRAHMQSFVDRFRAQATKARQAQSRIKALERMPVPEVAVDPASTAFAFPAPGELAPPVLVMDHASAGYDGRAVLRDLSLYVDMDDRIALLGANGNGKSTLAKLLAGRMAPIAGEVRRHPKLRVGYFAQHQAEELVMTDTPVDHMARALPRATPTQLRAQLARFGLDADRANTTVARLSGGEKARLLLTLATRDAPHLLILDEPTNHLDMDARDALVRPLAEFAGAVLLITHDAHLVELVADRLWLVNDGTVRTFDGDMEEYRTLLLDRGKPGRGGGADAAANKRDDRKERAGRREQTAPLRRRAKDAESRIAKLDGEKQAIERDLADPATYAKGGATVATHQARLGAIAKLVAEAEDEWMAAQEALEAAG